ncbi:N-6 DNA Methylase, partial [Sphingomonas sp. YR710]|uniref:type ISP restriction/modification enzyme n=1 Tax=Sphingomonas sp. YR710 TaxID=1882773 RepID=UPI000890A274
PAQSQGRVQTWVNSRWKLLAFPGHFSAAINTKLIHDITVEDFADIYAETIAYGLFAARLHDGTPDTFTRGEALDLLPKSNPFLRELFIYIAGPNLDERLRRVIDELCNVFCATDMGQVLRHFGKVTARQDPFLHFYEVFLAEYNPAKRKARGVWYTPEPVVNFIVRAVDEVLKTEFGLADGLADTSRITIDWDTGQNDKSGKPATIKKQVHRVQVLDPATGTGTFLAEVVKLVAERVKGIAPGQWSSYVEQDLIPRIHGFELLMASYAMCHMKLDMILTGLGYKPSAQPPRLGVYLTNSLEEGERVEQTLFGLSRAIAEEAKAASDIKRQTPIMCVIGNPPYSGISQNNGKWIIGKIEDYKYVDGVHFGERKHWLQDDYVKFIRLAEHMIEQNGEGVLGFITNHGYLNNPTFRGMRWHLMQTFDRIYVVDLHGSAKKHEGSPDGAADKNVFDIMQGVAIIIAVKKRTDCKKGKALADVRHGDLWGSREAKNEALWAGTAPVLSAISLPHKAPQYPFVPRDFDAEAIYLKGFSVADAMPVNATGIVTARDGLVVGFRRPEVAERIASFTDPSRPDSEVRAQFFGSRSDGKYLPGDTRGWKLSIARKALQSTDWQSDIQNIAYRPFDTRSILYRPDMVDWGRTEFMKNFLARPNVGLAICRQGVGEGWANVFIADLIGDDSYVSNRSKERGYFCPLYIYPNPNDPIYTDTGHLDERIRLNFDPKIYAQIRKAAGLSGAPAAVDGGAVETQAFRRATGNARPDEVKVLDYVYGVLHCPAYRETYAEFLKIDFPRIPFPSSPEVFAAVSGRGEALRRLHLMEDSAIGDVPYSFQGDGQSVIDKPRFESGCVWINASQYFANVPVQAWDFPIGGYQPAQKWLKDRKGRALVWDDIRHYQKIIKILAETDRIMREIELPLGRKPINGNFRICSAARVRTFDSEP